jgi:hypothetical protein
MHKGGDEVEPMSTTEHRVDGLLSRYVDGLLTAEEAVELAELVRIKRETARDAALSLCVHATLVLELRGDASFHDLTPSIMERVRALRVPERRSAPTVRWGVWASIAACLAIVAGSVFYNLRQTGTLSDKILAHVAATSPDVTVVRGDRNVVAVLKMTLQPGDTIVTDGRESITIGYEGETTRVQLRENTRLTLLGSAPAEGKRLRLEAGSLRARVAKQPEDKSMVVLTPHAEALIRGTVLRLASEKSSTRLDVTEGLVEFTITSDRETIEVPAGHYAVAGEGIDLVARSIPGTDLLLQLDEKASGAKTVADLKSLKDLARDVYEAELARGDDCDPVRLVYLGLACAITANPKEDRQADDLRLLLDRALSASISPEPLGTGLTAEERKTIRKRYARARRLAEELFFDEWFGILSPLMNGIKGRRPALTEALWMEDHYVTFYERGLPQFSMSFWVKKPPPFDEFPTVEYCRRELFPLMRKVTERNRRLEKAIDFPKITPMPRDAWKADKLMDDPNEPHYYCRFTQEREDTGGKLFAAVFPQITFERAVLTGQLRLRKLGPKPPDNIPCGWGLYGKENGKLAYRGQGINFGRVRRLELRRRWTWFLIYFERREDGSWGLARWEWPEGRQPHNLTSPDVSPPPPTIAGLNEDPGLMACGNKTYAIEGPVRIALTANNASVEWRALGLRILDPNDTSFRADPSSKTAVRYVEGPTLYTDDFSKGPDNWRIARFPEASPVGWEGSVPVPAAVRKAQVHGAPTSCAVIDATNVSSKEILIASFRHPVEADAFVVSAYVFLSPAKTGECSLGGWYRPSGPGNERKRLLFENTLPRRLFDRWVRVRTEFIHRPDDTGRFVWESRTFWDDRLSVLLQNTVLDNTVHLRMRGCKAKIADFSIRKLVPADTKEEK